MTTCLVHAGHVQRANIRIGLAPRSLRGLSYLSLSLSISLFPLLSLSHSFGIEILSGAKESLLRGLDSCREVYSFFCGGDSHTLIRKRLIGLSF